MPRDPDAPWRKARQATPEPHVARLQKRVAKGETLAEAAEALGLPLWLAKAVFRRSGLPLPRPPQYRRQRLLRGAQTGSSASGRTPSSGRRRTGPPKLDEFGLLLALRLLSHQLGAERGARGGVPVTRAEWDARRDPAVHPTASAITARFGGWSAACEQAGVPLRGRATRPRWTEQQCLDAVRAFLRASPSRTSGADYGAWAAGREVPSYPTVCDRLGPWPQVRARAGG